MNGKARRSEGGPHVGGWPPLSSIGDQSPRPPLISALFRYGILILATALLGILVLLPASGWVIFLGWIAWASILAMTYAYGEERPR